MKIFIGLRIYITMNKRIKLVFFLELNRERILKEIMNYQMEREICKKMILIKIKFKKLQTTIKASIKIRANKINIQK